MRMERKVQTSIFERCAEHEIGLELQAMSTWLDAHPEVLARVAADLKSGEALGAGRRGLSCESALRCAILKQYRQLTYEDLAFCLLDSIKPRCRA
ncbi:hypothetical protein RM530_08905 [Algiphilus sp. W345]|uniref:Uncharacterized protein n=1 Tax=Banduia mediterranea TaxID=3075609 RepID=A0ABU2WHX9_9GAMM|nr:hypothetical protein [Algiphilus sp. W345]MDT0497479.1 hypothetical protein [Algiphilus sp. W345]